MKRLIALVLVGCCVGLTEVLPGQGHDQQDSIGRTLPTGRPVELPTLDKSKHIPTDPDEIAPAAGQRTKFDVAQARRQAQELAELAQKISAQVDQLSKNLLPKDLIRELKQVEKLSRRLRAQLSQ